MLPPHRFGITLLLAVLAGRADAVVEVIRPSEAFGLLAHCRRYAAERSVPFDFLAEVVMRTGHLLAVDGTFDGKSIDLVPKPRTARDLAAGSPLAPGVAVFARLVITLTPDGTDLAEMTGTGPSGTTRIVFRSEGLQETVTSNTGTSRDFTYALADSELYTATDHGAPSEGAVQANPGGGGGAAGTGAPGTGLPGQAVNRPGMEALITFPIVSPTS